MQQTKQEEQKSLIDELNDAWQLASIHHNNQKYGGQEIDLNIDYISHIGRVTLEISNAIDFNPQRNKRLSLLCAILHDILEDTNVLPEEITNRFGTDVTEGILALTKRVGKREGFDAMNDSLFRIKQQPEEIWMVKMADRIANLYAPPFYWNNAKKQQYIEEAIQISEALGSASPYLAKRLSTRIEEYKVNFTHRM
jgi:(p)ppGpp synthase/HD superfamily hydrolase